MKENENNNYSGVAVISLLLHTALLGILFLGVDFTKVRSQPIAGHIQAIIIESNVVKEQVRNIRQQRDEEKRQENNRLRRLEQQEKELKKQRKETEKQIQQLRLEKLAAEKAAHIAKEKMVVIETEHKQKIAEWRNAEEVAAKKADAERERAEKVYKNEYERKQRQRKLADKQKRLIAEQQKTEEAMRQSEGTKKEWVKQEAALNEVFSELESEFTNRGTAREQQVANEVTEWSGRFVSIIQKNWIVDSSMDGHKCRLNLKLAPDGLVIDVLTISGSPELCRSAIASVTKVSKFTMPLDVDVVTKLRDLNLNFVR
ncbi:cell envelope integrity protein TolA [Candidatus Enterovibrio escicola]|uniref:cell envelope integrity protein TolA n=1 Tax=Candidatus Enterovibrio escicola TaxID=1927127 RepID=UPI00123818D6|nr:cell envelope integrity protein TolA [Candidatus Enterovibrio escacola]